MNTDCNAVVWWLSFVEFIWQVSVDMNSFKSVVNCVLSYVII